MESKLLKFSVLILTIMFLMLGCSPFKPQVRKSPEGELPQAYSIGVDTHDPSQRWWEEFNDPQLNRLVQQALSGNFTLKEAWARLKQANASAVQVRSALYPDLTGTGGTAHGRQRTENGNAQTRTIKEYSLGLLSTYELDLWGRIRSENEAALLEATATRQDVNTYLFADSFCSVS